MGELLYCVEPKCDSRGTTVIDYGNEAVGVCELHKGIMLRSFPQAADKMEPLTGTFQVPHGWARIIQQKIPRSPNGVSSLPNKQARIPRTVGRKQIPGGMNP